MPPYPCHLPNPDIDHQGELMAADDTKIFVLHFVDARILHKYRSGARVTHVEASNLKAFDLLHEAENAMPNVDIRAKTDLPTNAHTPNIVACLP